MGSNKKEEKKERQLMVSCSKNGKNFYISKHYSFDEVLFGRSKLLECQYQLC